MSSEIIIAFTITFFVRIISATTGGAGLILIPTLISLGLTPSVAIATNRFGATGNVLSIIRFHQDKQVKWSLGKLLIIPTLIGTILGTIVVINIDQNLYQKIIGLVIILSLPFVFYKKNIGLKEFEISKTRKRIGILLTVVASFMGGVFASSGLWFTYLFLFFGLTMLQTAGTRKFLGTIIASVSVVMLIFANLINWPIAIAVLIASLLGGWVGADLGIKAGNLWVKRIFITAVVLMALKIILF
ncbi:sulfite exporter TauE/SafE family protein [Patescibacteria group bacterium]|nr:sulfite exporter TauE/SafE family protein [Patescibacteria group bacterium]